MFYPVAGNNCRYPREGNLGLLQVHPLLAANWVAELLGLPALEEARVHFFGKKVLRKP